MNRIIKFVDKIFAQSKILVNFQDIYILPDFDVFWSHRIIIPANFADQENYKFLN